MSDPDAPAGGRNLARRGQRPFVRYSEEVAQAICARIAAGGSLSALQDEPGFPHRTAVAYWAARRPEFARALETAKSAARLAERAADRRREAARPPRRKGGRRLTYTPAIAEEICLRLANGESLTAIGRDPAMPCYGTILGWVKRFPDFQDAYVQARLMQADYLFDEARDIANQATLREVPLARLRFDVIRWQTARLAPRKYGERLIVAEAPAPPPPQMITVEFVRPAAPLLSPREAERERAGRGPAFDKPPSP